MRKDEEISVSMKDECVLSEVFEIHVSLRSDVGRFIQAVQLGAHSTAVISTWTWRYFCTH